MGEQLVIRGVPARLEKDAWWFIDADEGGAASGGATPPLDGTRLPPKALAALALMIALADQVFWDRDLGVSVALYALALAAGMVALKPGGVTGREAALAIAFMAACVAPVIEIVQPLSLMFCAAGLAALLIWVVLGTSPKASQALTTVVDAVVIQPFAFPLDVASDLRRAGTDVDFPAVFRATALPVGIGVLFLILFAVANPLIEQSIGRLAAIAPLSPEHLTRPFFWIVAACLVWPLLHFQARLGAGDHVPPSFTLPSTGLINPASVRTSLILFNVMFALQTASDIGVLTGGVTLPEGMTYAGYAHRGAYPLLVTALLSGVFAMATHRMVAGNTVLRTLMYLWLGQTLFLVVTAAVRLGLYVEAYSLTHLRVAAFIWMALIFVGLVLIIVQMVQDRPFSWLLKANLITLTGTLYLCCFINFSYLITDYNMANAAPDALDLAYLCGLGEQVIPAMMDYGQITDQTACGRGNYPAIRFEPIEHWQEWGFRRWRLQRYLEAYHDL
ncbi:DUF4153 domain-containing protein [Gymnodinialimonas sp.]